MPKKKPKPAKTKLQNRTLDARRDTLDFRDKMYSTGLLEVPVEIPLREYLKHKVPILDQGSQGACTGYGLATVAHFLLRGRKRVPDIEPVSAKMLYDLARRYDEWPGENYSGSSARGAMKGWHKHGLCKESCYPNNSRNRQLTEERTSDALMRPLGAYYRVNHKDLVAMHSAMAEVGILYATADVHEGWDEVGADGRIVMGKKNLGGHAFAIVAYDSEGFWIQNSWGTDWGKRGFARIGYDDWLKNASDVWVARLGAPVTLNKVESIAISHSAAAQKSQSYAFADLRPHIISLGNDGVLKPGGPYGTSKEEVSYIFEEDFPRVTSTWKKKRLLLYAHGGLVSEEAAVQRLADYRKNLLAAEIYPISFIWHSDAWSTITNVLQEAVRKRRPEGILDVAKDFLLDRLDDMLEILAGPLTGRMQWKEMKENARMATEHQEGGVRFALQQIAALAGKQKIEIHVIGHSAGSILLGPAITMMRQELKLNMHSCTLWAPACTLEFFRQHYLPAINTSAISRFTVFNLTDEAERDDHCANVYHKSLLYLVSRSLEDKTKQPLSGAKGTPLLGMQTHIEEDAQIRKLFASGKAELVLSPNTNPADSDSHATARAHGAFDDDAATVKSTLSRILNKKAVAEFTFSRSASSLMDRRSVLNQKNMQVASL